VHSHSHFGIGKACDGAGQRQVTDIGIRTEGGEGDARASRLELYIENKLNVLPVYAHRVTLLIDE
jgi:hypothetical protein